jgi:hypothetical protein
MRREDKTINVNTCAHTSIQRRDHVIFPTGDSEACALRDASLSHTLSTTKSCESKTSLFPSGKHFVGSSLPLRRVISPSVSRCSFEFFVSTLTNPDSYPSADDLDPVPSGSIGGGGDVAMGVLGTSLAALQTGSALVTNVPFISPVAGLILQALQMRGVRSDHCLYMSRVLTRVC